MKKMLKINALLVWNKEKLNTNILFAFFSH